MSGIFISYRRDDSRGTAGRLYDALKDHFGKDRVFRDLDAVEPGADYAVEIDDVIESCSAVVVVIGNQWLDIRDEDGRRRLFDTEDLVHKEVAAALATGKPVIPVTVEDAPMPSSAKLPSELSHLARRNALPLSDARWDYDVGRLLRRLEEDVPASVPATPSAEISTGSTPGDGNGPGDEGARRAVAAPGGRRALGAVALALVLAVGGVIVAFASLGEPETEPDVSTLDSTTLGPTTLGSTLPSSVSPATSVASPEPLPTPTTPASGSLPPRTGPIPPATATMVPARPITLALESWYSAQRGDNSATTHPDWAKSAATRSPDYTSTRTEGYVFSPDAAPPQGTVALVSWYSAGRGDNLTTTHPDWAKSAATRSPDYTFYRAEGYVFSPDAAPPPGTVALVSWYSASRGDNFITTHPEWGPSTATRSPDYKFYRLEGYVYPTKP